MKRPSKLKVSRLPDGGARVSMKAADELAWLGAAYAMTAEAYVLVEDGAVALWPKKRATPAALARAFAAEYESLAVRWAAARGGLGVRAEVLRRALALLAERPSGEEAAPRLDDEQAERIRALLAEADADPSPQDPLGIRTPWSELRRG